MTISDSRTRFAHAAGLVMVALLLQLPLIANPGYFSHDELQWASRAIAGVSVDWLDVGALQYRPLTFTAWLALSRALFAQPMLFHTVIALLGAANAGVLASVLRRAGAAPRLAFAAALGFVLNPYAMYVHGWVATLGDLIWCLCALVIARTTLGGGRGRMVVAASAVLTVIALLAKESALSIPALAVVAFVADRARRPRWGRVVAATSAVAAAYVLVRYRALANVPDADSYAWHVANIPVRLMQFEVYPLLPRVFEVHNTFVVPRAAELWLAAIGLAVPLAVLGRCGWRRAAAFIGGGAAALGPVLVLDNPATQYGYALAAWNVGAFALAWPRIRRVERGAVLIAASVIALHAALVARSMLHVGQIQAAYSPAVASAVRNSHGIVRVAPSSPDEAWIFVRLSHQIPTYNGVVLMERLQVVAADEHPDYLIAPDGTLKGTR